MKNPVLVRLLTVVTIVVLACTALADQPEKPPTGQAKYLIVLWHPGTPVPGKKEDRMKKVPEPDVAKLGGRVLASQVNRRVVFLPYGVAKKLRKHAAVSYIQRIWTGEDFSEWNETDAAATRPERIASNSEQFTWSKDYTYDADGNVTHIGSAASGHDEFAYDGVGRLTEAVVNGAPETYFYDAFGNLTGVGRPAGGRAIPVDPATNRLVGANYDAAGNITTREERGEYAYDPLNMIVEYETTLGDPRRILYDANDERIGMTDGLTTQRWTIRDFDGQVLREFKGDQLGVGMMWWWEQDHIRGEGQLIAGETQTWSYSPDEENPSQFTYGGKRHYHLDHLGSVRIVTNQAGKAIAENDFFPFGAARTRQYQEQLNEGDPHTDGMRFAGHWRDFMGHPNVEGDDYLDYMHARYYDPHLGRFLSVDPGRDWDPKQPQSWNMYAYVRNNPVGNTDPDGRQVAPKLAETYEDAKDKIQPVADVLNGVAPFTGAAAITALAAKTLGLGTATGEAIGSDASSTKLTLAISKDVATASEAFVALGGAASPFAATRSTIVNLGGTGEVAGSNVVNVQAATIGGDTGVALRNAVDIARSSGQRVVMAHGDALPFQTGSIRTVVTNNVPIDRGVGHFGRSFSSSEIGRILAPLGRWFGSSAP